MQADQHESFPTVLAGDPPYRFPIFEHLLDLCWSNTPKSLKTSVGLPPPPACPLVTLQSTLEATQTYFAHPEHILDSAPARIAQVESETESMVAMFKGLLRKDVKEVQRSGMCAYPASKALVAHAQGVLGEKPDVGSVKGNDEGRRAAAKGSGALSAEEVMMMLSCY
ncbi:hypothetical protein QFC24_002252 [Naganishia onofrii]|uniref:Uncharacterized protein n=1 Tax=Naganishia onofrii TaxID=1851511 RepID=A0ACC2XPJ1_9TREE|nr:hypothetical protein QFC24_002252 [Naganishia onofrii]